MAESYHPTREQLGLSLSLGVGDDDMDFLERDEEKELLASWKKEKSTLGSMIFDEFDADESGYIESKELHKMIHKLGMAMTPQQLKVVRKMLDTNGDGQIDKKEFIKWLEDQSKARSEAPPEGQEQAGSAKTAASSSNANGEQSEKFEEAVTPTRRNWVDEESQFLARSHRQEKTVAGKTNPNSPGSPSGSGRRKKPSQSARMARLSMQKRPQDASRLVRPSSVGSGVGRSTSRAKHQHSHGRTCERRDQAVNGINGKKALSEWGDLRPSPIKASEIGGLRSDLDELVKEFNFLQKEVHERHKEFEAARKTVKELDRMEIAQNATVVTTRPEVVAAEEMKAAALDLQQELKHESHYLDCLDMVHRRQKLANFDQSKIITELQEELKIKKRLAREWDHRTAELRNSVGYLKKEIIRRTEKEEKEKRYRERIAARGIKYCEDTAAVLEARIEAARSMENVMVNQNAHKAKQRKHDAEQMESYQLTVKIEQRQADLKTYNEAYRAICKATGISDINEVARRCYTQEQSTQKLNASSQEINQRMRESSAQLEEMEAEVIALRQSGIGRLVGTRKLLEKERRALTDYRSQLHRASTRAHEVDQLSGTTCRGLQGLVDHLRLIDFGSRGQSSADDAAAWQATGNPVSPTNMSRWLRLCSDRISKVIAAIPLKRGAKIAHIALMRDMDESDVRIEAWTAEKREAAEKVAGIYDELEEDLNKLRSREKKRATRISKLGALHLEAAAAAATDVRSSRRRCSGL